MDLIRFNVPPYLGIEKQYINNAIDSKHISGDGDFTKSCHKYLEENFSIKKALLTTSGTAALDMAALLCNTENKMNVGGGMKPFYRVIPFQVQRPLLYSQVLN